MFAVVTVVAILLPLVSGHGRLLEPPARNSMWRYGYPNPENYDDDALYCAGITIQHNENDGKCGICGDGYHELIRDHEVNGKFFNNIITRTYRPGSAVDIFIELKTNHDGWFEFKICPYKTTPPNREVTQECLNKNVLDLSDGSGKKWYIPPGSEKADVSFKLKLNLPPGLTCEHCLLQWHWETANFWGECENGTQGLGCGEQEHYVNCADISVKELKFTKVGPLMPVHLRPLHNDYSSHNLNRKSRDTGRYPRSPGLIKTILGAILAKKARKQQRKRYYG